MSLTLQPVRVATGSADEDGRLVFADGRLIGVLVQLSAEHGEIGGQWFVEASFDRLDGTEHPTFQDLGEAKRWLARRLTPDVDEQDETDAAAIPP